MVWSKSNFETFVETKSILNNFIGIMTASAYRIFSIWDNTIARIGTEKLGYC